MDVSWAVQPHDVMPVYTSPLPDHKMSTTLAIKSGNITIHTPSGLKAGFQALGVPVGGGISRVSGFVDSSAGPNDDASWPQAFCRLCTASLE